MNLREDGWIKRFINLGLHRICCVAGIIKHYRYLLRLQDEEQILKRLPNCWRRHALVPDFVVTSRNIFLRRWPHRRTLRSLYLWVQFRRSGLAVLDSDGTGSACLRTDILPIEDNKCK